MKKIVAFITAVVVGLSLTACSSSSSVDGVKIEGKINEKPTVTFEKGAKAPTELVSKVLVEGDGKEISNTSVVSADYYGVVWGEKEPFDESFTRESSFTFQMNKNVIEGWSKGLEGKKIGSRVLLIIPPDLGYGSAGSPPKIKANATLVFVIDIIDASTKTDRSVMKDAKATKSAKGVDGISVKGDLTKAPTVSFDKNAEAPKEKSVVVLYEGKGEKAQLNDYLQVFPTVYSWGSSEPLQTGIADNGVPFILPVSQMAATQDFAGIPIGSRVMLIEPAENGVDGQTAPANVYIIDVVGKLNQRLAKTDSK